MLLAIFVYPHILKYFDVLFHRDAKKNVHYKVRDGARENFRENFLMYSFHVDVETKTHH